MAEKVVQDSDEEDLDSPVISPKGVLRTCGVNSLSKGWLQQSQDTSSDSLKDKIEDIQNVLLQSDIEGHCLAQVSSVFPAAKSRPISTSPEVMTPCTTYSTLPPQPSTCLLLGEEPMHDMLSVGQVTDYHKLRKSTSESASLQTDSVLLSRNEALQDGQEDNLEFLGDGSSTIPYGSQTQRNLVDRAIADLGVQNERTVYDENICGNTTESESLSLPLSKQFLHQKDSTGHIKRFSFNHLENFSTGHRSSSSSSSLFFPQTPVATCVTDSQSIFSPDRRKRFKTEPMCVKPHLRSDADDELCVSAGILSAAVPHESRAINVKATPSLKRGKKRNLHEPDDINAHDNMILCGFKDSQQQLQSECNNPRSRGSKTSQIKIEDIGIPLKMENLAKKRHRDNLSKNSDKVARNDVPSYDGYDQGCRHGSIKQEVPRKGVDMEVINIATSEPTTSEVQIIVQTETKQKLDILEEMGFCPIQAAEVLRGQNGDVDKTVQILLNISTSSTAAEAREPPRRTSKRSRRGNESSHNREPSVFGSSKSETDSGAFQNRTTSSKASRTVQVEVMRPKDQTLRDKLYTKIDILSQEALRTADDNINDEDCGASIKKIDRSPKLKYCNGNDLNEHASRASSLHREVADCESAAVMEEKATNKEHQGKGRGKPQKKTNQQTSCAIIIREDCEPQSKDLAVKELPAEKGRPTTPLADLRSSSTNIVDKEKFYENASPKTPPSKGRVINDSSPSMVKIKDQTPKSEKGRPNHSPLSKSHVPFRVGLSRSARIMPLLRSVKK